MTALLVLFQDAGPLPETAPHGDKNSVGNEHLERLEAELRLTKERLQATIEELESINEELQTVNTELDIRVRDLARANSDLQNLLESTQIATIFLDNDLRVRSFTPTATELFHLQETDIGRPIDHLGSRVDYPDLSEDVRRVIAKVGAMERDVSSKEGRSYIARVLPYRSVDNFIAGAVITFVDVTSTVKAESALREGEARLRTLLAELQHRVRNTLAMVKSITQRMAKSSDSVDEWQPTLSGGSRPSPASSQS